MRKNFCFANGFFKLTKATTTLTISLKTGKERIGYFVLRTLNSFLLLNACSTNILTLAIFDVFFTSPVVIWFLYAALGGILGETLFHNQISFYFKPSVSHC